MSAARPGSAPYRFAEGVLTLSLHVQPAARSTGWDGLHGGAVRLKLAAPPADGKANQACIRYLAQEAGVPRSAVEIVRGLSSRQKTLRIQGVTPERFLAMKSAWSA